MTLFDLTYRADRACRDLGINSTDIEITVATTAEVSEKIRRQVQQEVQTLMVWGQAPMPEEGEAMQFHGLTIRVVTRDQ